MPALTAKSNRSSYDFFRQPVAARHAISTIYAVCCLAGAPAFVDDGRNSLRRRGVGLTREGFDTPTLFDELMRWFSFQGIADAIAESYLARHGSIRWNEVAQALKHQPSCAKLHNYWQFDNCGYHKGGRHCNEPDHFAACPVPTPERPA